MKNPGRFVVIRFVVRWGRVLPWLAALLCVGVGGVIASSAQSAAPASLCVLVGAAFAWGVTRLVVELVDLVAETLLPR